MAKVKVEVLDAVVDGKRKGEVVELDEKQAKYLETIRYVKIVDDTPAPKATTKKTTTKK